MSIDAFSQEIFNRFRQIPADKVANPLEVVLLIAGDVAEDFRRDCPEALQEFIAIADERDRENRE